MCNQGDNMSFKSKINIAIFALVFLAAANTAAEATKGYSVDLAVNNTLGTYLVNQTGFTLYYSINDDPVNGTSSCYDNCSEIWPPFYAENLTVARGLKAADFSMINRTDGLKQIAFKGWPLYLYSQDTKPNDVYGQSVDEVWSVINPTSSAFRQSSPSILKLKPETLSIGETERGYTSSAVPYEETY